MAPTFPFQCLLLHLILVVIIKVYYYYPSFSGNNITHYHKGLLNETFDTTQVTASEHFTLHKF